MEGKRRIPNYRKMYPTASEEVITVLKQSERRLQYQEYDRKVGKFVFDEDKQKAYFLPSREDSLERLVEAEVQFRDENTNVEEIVIKDIMIQKLRESIKLLEPEDYELINALFYENKSESEYALQIGISQKGINKRKAKVILKIKKIMKI